MELNLDDCHAALAARDPRFDGLFFVGVSSTGIYCRPVCPSRLPAKRNCDFFRTPAAAERAGYRPCLRCRPELAPGTATVDAVDTLAARAVECIKAGALDHHSVDDLAAELGVGSRHLRRVVEQAYGVTPVGLAQTQRLLLAKRLLTDTTLRVSEVATASGFSSLRRFNHLFRSRYRMNPSALRRGRGQATAGSISIKLHYRPPLAWGELRDFLLAREAVGVAAGDGERYVRAVRIDNVSGWVAVADAAAESALVVELSETLLPVLGSLMARLRRLFDLDANPPAVAACLEADPPLAASVATAPGLRLPGTFDGFELALRTVIGQQVSVRGATTIYSRAVERLGSPVETPFEAVSCAPPTAQAVAAASIDAIAGLGMPGRRAKTVQMLARAIADGELSLEPGADPAAIRRQLVAMPGIGDWTAQYLSMRGLGDADAFPASDLGVLRALKVKTAREAEIISQAWRPWRAYAVMHLWRHAAGG